MISTTRFIIYCGVAIIIGQHHQHLSTATAHTLSDRPKLTYGTAWKKDDTSKLVNRAIHAGFRHIDTACQPRHYNERGVGDGWTSAAKELNLQRSDIWIQTKFSGINAHDPNNVPYDKNAPLEDRVRQSLAKSLENLQTDYIDSWLMHGPEDNWDDHFKVWRTMEAYVDEGKVGQLGISNFYRLEDVQWVYDNARIKPKVSWCFGASKSRYFLCHTKLLIRFQLGSLCIGGTKSLLFRFRTRCGD